jgi:polyphenol oxidase
LSTCSGRFLKRAPLPLNPSTTNRDYTYKTVKTSSTERHRSQPSTRKSPSSPWLEHTSHGLRILQVPAFSKLPWLTHGFSTRPGGVSSVDGEHVLNLGAVDWDTRENVMLNRRRFQTALGADALTLLPLSQFHSDVVCVFDSGVPEEPCRGDASITSRPGLLLAVQTADCAPVLLVDPKKRAVAAVHAGWRGTLQRITEKTVGRMNMQFGSRPQDMLAAIGPCIGGCCYGVGTEVAAAFAAQFPSASEFFDELRTGDEPNPLQWLTMMPPGHQPPPGKVLLDLRKANRSQLVEAGVRRQNIFASDLCTACRTDLLFSYRKERARSGRLMSVIGIRQANRPTAGIR